MKKAVRNKLADTIENTLTDLLNGKVGSNVEERNEIRQNLSIAVKWAAVKNKLEDQTWGEDLEKELDE